MDFTFSTEQQAFRDAISRFLMTEAAPEMLREIWETEGGRSPALRVKLAEQGLTALSIPQAHGGMGLGDIDWALITQELGYYAISDSLADTAYVAAGLLAGLPAEHHLCQHWLPLVANGSARLAVGHPVNPWVADAHVADLLLIAHPTPTGLSLHAVTRDEVQLEPLPSIDASRRLARVQWKPSAKSEILNGASAQSLWDLNFDRASLNTSGQLIGLAQRMLDLSVDYVTQRKQFGKLIGSFQAVKHHLADVVTKIEFAKPVLYRAVLALADASPDRAALVSHAKLASAEAAWTAGRKGIQVHGAMGYTWEVDLQMFMKRAWVLDSAWGDRGFHNARLAEKVLSTTAAPRTGARLGV